ncbi:hypothetical protein GmHk_05G012951 [Glycine max]|nr:hypothetical protein GmHk_05G012951 [Glycine max]
MKRKELDYGFNGVGMTGRGEQMRTLSDVETKNMFKDLKIILPFTNFKYGVLTKMNVSPTQLHPNTTEDRKVGRVSMTSSHGALFTLFNQSWKKFKTRLFRDRPNPIYPDHKKLFYKPDEVTRRFPLYWQDEDQRFKSQEDGFKAVLNFPYCGNTEKALEGEYCEKQFLHRAHHKKDQRVGMASIEERKKFIKAINEKNLLLTKKIEIIDGLQQKIVDHEKMVSMKVVENEILVKAIESINKKFSIEIKDLT